MKAASAMEAATTVESATALKSTVNCGTTMEATYRSASIEARTPVEAGVTPVSRMPPIAVVPRACADEDATDKPIRTVVAIGRARVRRIRVIPIGANRRCANIGGTDSHRHRADCDANANLRLRRGRRNHERDCQNCHEAKNFCVSHFGLLLSSPNCLYLEAQLALSTDYRHDKLHRHCQSRGKRANQHK